MSKYHFQRLNYKYLKGQIDSFPVKLRRFYNRHNFDVGQFRNRRNVKKEKIADVEAEIQIQEFYEEGKGLDDINFCDGCNLDCNFCKLF